MAVVRQLVIGLGFKIDNMGLEAVDNAMDRIDRRLIGTGRRSRFLTYLLANLATDAFYMLTHAIGAASRALVENNIEMERLQGALFTITGSVEEANRQWDELLTFASRTPFEIEQSVRSFIKLKNLGLNPSIRALSSYGNTAVSVGKTVDDMMEAVADAAFGHFRRLREFGIKANHVGDKIEFIFQGVRTQVEETPQAIEEFLISLGEVNFAGAMEDQMTKLSGLTSNLKDEIFRFTTFIGEGGFNSALRDLIRTFSKLLSEGEDFGNLIGGTLGIALRSLNGVLEFTNKYSALLKAIFTALTAAAMIRGLMLFAKGIIWLKGAFVALSGATKLILFDMFFFLAALTGIVLGLQDVYIFLTGGESVIGKWVDKWRDAPGVVGDVARALDDLAEHGGPAMDMFITDMIVANGKLENKMAEMNDRFIKFFSFEGHPIFNMPRQLGEAFTFMGESFVGLLEMLAAGLQKFANDLANGPFRTLADWASETGEGISESLEEWLGQGEWLDQFANDLGGRVSASVELQTADLRGHIMPGGALSPALDVQRSAAGNILSSSIGQVIVNMYGEQNMSRQEVAESVEEGIRRANQGRLNNMFGAFLGGDL